MKKILKIIISIFLLLAVLFAIVMIIPSLRARVLYQAEQLWIRLDYKLNPPEENLFTPATQSSEDMHLTQTAQSILAATLTPTITPDLVLPTQTPTLTPTPIPEQVSLIGVKYQTQKGFFNFCAPANLTMALSFWGWQGDVNEVGAFLKPYNEDKNVMPYEIANYVEEKTDLAIITRYGGTLELLKKLLAAGYPVLIEKGTFSRDITGKISWMGHYNVLTGYDDAAQIFIVQDSLLSADYKISYDFLLSEWRGFNYIFQVIFPPNQQERVKSILGEYSDEMTSYQIAARIASDEAVSLSGNDQFHAWFNRGTSLQLLQDYIGSAAAYDQAFQLLPILEKDTRPWRIMWYETGPYFSYYFTGRYQDLVNLATTTIDAATQPYFEESFYWRALGYAALGNLDAAREDFCTSLKYHPDFPPTLEQMQSLGLDDCTQ